ncbi:MAG: chromate transporter [Methylophilaceae bacterium]|nr:chromate transporter [Methylophilaceae bacterium]
MCKLIFNPRLSRRLCSVVIFISVISTLIWAFGAQHMLTQSAWFYTKSALLTLGGAYAVLPYIAHALVEQFQWISPAQMMDGLALGETTPGPLIMVISFVSFVAGWNQALFGSHDLLLSGVIASLVATFFTFLPSYVMVLLGAPLIQASGQQLHLKAPLSAISAAVVGVIMHLAIYFGHHVLWIAQGFDLYALLLALLAFYWLQKQQASPLLVILACAGIGMVKSLF